jgi:nucleoid DNA-binding protein
VSLVSLYAPRDQQQSSLQTSSFHRIVAPDTLYVTNSGGHLIKQDLIQRVVERTGLVRTKAEAAVDAIFESMKQSLVEGDRIELRGFGVFTVKPRKTGVGRNPRTGAEVTIAPGKAVRFKPGKELHVIE